MKKLEKFIGEGGIDNITIMREYRTLYDEGLQTAEVQTKLIEYAGKVLDGRKWNSATDPRKILKRFSIDVKGINLLKNTKKEK
ncbi:MAG: hypothetical protein ABIG20_00705 [archaeon]